MPRLRLRGVDQLVAAVIAAGLIVAVLGISVAGVLRTEVGLAKIASDVYYEMKKSGIDTSAGLVPYQSSYILVLKALRGGAEVEVRVYCHFSWGSAQVMDTNVTVTQEPTTLLIPYCEKPRAVIIEKRTGVVYSVGWPS